MERFSQTSIKDSISTLPSSRSPKNSKLQAFYSRKIADTHVTLMTNRLNQLQKIKNRTEKEVNFLHSQILKEKQSIRDRSNELLQKRRFSQDNFEFLQQKTQKNREKRLGNREKIKNFKESLLKHKQNIVKEKQENAFMWQEELTEFKAKNLNNKSNQYKKVKTGYVRAIRERCVSQRNYKSQIRSLYEESIENEKKSLDEAANKITQLESAETVLIDDLAKTLEVHHSLQAKLQRLRTLSL